MLEVDPVDPGTARPFPDEAHDRLDRVALAFEDRLDAPVRFVRNPARNPARLRAPSRRLPEEDALDMTADRDSRANHGRSLTLGPVAALG